MQKKTYFHYIQAGIAFSLSLLFMSCASTTTIHSTDPEAKIYIDGEYKGMGSAMHTDTKIVFASTNVTLKKKGCREKHFTFSRTEEFDVGPCIGGAFLFPFFLWVMKYKQEHSYDYDCNKDTSSLEPFGELFNTDRRLLSSVSP
jgi:hypothetical protein